MDKLLACLLIAIGVLVSARAQVFKGKSSCGYMWRWLTSVSGFGHCEVSAKLERGHFARLGPRHAAGASRDSALCFGVSRKV
ncbi:hypothetical protein QQF64_015759 [Cirrhinus molitorella]|uniref:Uncharacterized protein n=1 Tax=Cirrhinus molitorella TaxID=172907 RepID=A0ABR3NVU0_9TELE